MGAGVIVAFPRQTRFLVAWLLAGLVSVPVPVVAADRVEVPVAGASAITAVSAGKYHTCAIKTDGTLACWGSNSHGQASPPTGTFTAVSAGGLHTCAIREGGTPACWGWDWGGQATPVPGTFSAVDAGGVSCGVRTDGTLACWGYSEMPQVTPPEGTFTTVSVGENHACAIKDDGGLACWGSYEYGQATPPEGTFTAVSAGLEYTCGVRDDGGLACWGSNGYGQATPPEGTFSAVSAGEYHTCGVRDDGTLACWGSNGYGQATPPEGTFTTVSVGENHACAIKDDGGLACWGRNTNGQVTPAPVAQLASVPKWLATRTIPLSWQATALSAVTTYDVRHRRAEWSTGTYGSWVRWKSATRLTSARFRAAPGYTYCFSVRARDADGGISSWSRPKASACVAIPLDDRSLGRSRGWGARTGTRFYRDTALRSSSRGAALKLATVVGRRIALLASTCPTCGTVKIYWNGEPLTTVSLFSAARTDRVLIPVVTFPNSRAGRLRIKVVSSGRQVIIDGLAIRRGY